MKGMSMPKFGGVVAALTSKPKKPKKPKKVKAPKPMPMGGGHAGH